MKTNKLNLVIALVIVIPFVISSSRCVKSDELSGTFTDLQHRYVQGHISAREYERLKYRAQEQQSAELRHLYYQGHMSQDEARRLTEAVAQQYAAAYSPMMPDELVSSQAAFRQESLAFAGQTGPMVEVITQPGLDAKTIDVLQHKYYQGHISAREYEQRKFDSKQQVMSAIQHRYYQGHISAREARVLENRMDRDYAGLYSPMTTGEQAQLEKTFEQDAARIALNQEINNPVTATGSSTGYQYPAPPNKSKAQLLDELLKLYKEDKMTPHQYQKERARILGLPD
jgi:uncharacterized membrane protein